MKLLFNYFYNYYDASEYFTLFNNFQFLKLPSEFSWIFSKFLL